MRKLVGLMLLLASCTPTPEEAFVGDRREDYCNGAIPVCTATAGCIADGSNYVTGDFATGATRRLIVRTVGEAAISVSIYFVTEESPGSETEIAWYEPGCTDRYLEPSLGKDVFNAAGVSHTYVKERTVYKAGDHLVEVFSDAVAKYRIKVDVLPH